MQYNFLAGEAHSQSKRSCRWSRPPTEKQLVWTRFGRMTGHVSSDHAGIARVHGGWVLVLSVSDRPAQSQRWPLRGCAQGQPRSAERPIGCPTCEAATNL
eukprot:6663843-Prymnesium_polylepis.1